jgi:hypothetical protein
MYTTILILTKKVDLEKSRISPEMHTGESAQVSGIIDHNNQKSLFRSYTPWYTTEEKV